jgi:hypothetical protein
VSDRSAALPLATYEATTDERGPASAVGTTPTASTSADPQTTPDHELPDADYARRRWHIYNRGAHLQFFDDGSTAIAIPTEDGDGFEFFTLDEKGPVEEVRQEILAELEEEARAMMEEELAGRGQEGRGHPSGGSDQRRRRA